MKTICYLAGGYPTMEKSVEMAKKYIEGGCDAIEWSLPPEDGYMDPVYIAEKMKIAYDNCSDYNLYLKKLENFIKDYPDIEIFLLLYQETMEEIGVERLIKFLKENNIDTIISANLNNKELKKELEDKGIKIAVSVTYKMTNDEIEKALDSDGFVYMQAMPTKEDIENGLDKTNLEKSIKKLRKIGIDRPIYCGVGIRKPEDVDFIRESGGQGYFLGSGIMKYYDEPEKLVSEIKKYKEIANKK